MTRLDSPWNLQSIPSVTSGLGGFPGSPCSPSLFFARSSSLGRPSSRPPVTLAFCRISVATDNNDWTRAGFLELRPQRPRYLRTGNATRGSIMSDPRFEDRRIDPPLYDNAAWRRRYAENMGDGSGWILAAVIAAVVVVGLLAFGMNGSPTTTASGPGVPQTTGQAPPRPAPAPMTTPAPPPANR
jgi:hypothetical protein